MKLFVAVPRSINFTQLTDFLYALSDDFRTKIEVNQF